MYAIARQPRRELAIRICCDGNITVLEKSKIECKNLDLTMALMF